MYFWKIESLKKDIKENKLTEKDKFIYLFISIILSTIGMELMTFMPLESNNIWDFIESVSNIFIVALGTLFAFKANGGTTGTDFLGKYFSISLVISIRFWMILIAIFIGLILFDFYTLEIETTFLETTLYLLWFIAMYWRIFKHIKDVKDS